MSSDNPTNKLVSDLVTSIDNKIDWVYNKYCKNCSRYVYDEYWLANKCKCGSILKNNVVLNPLPFLTSGTALEKLLTWCRGFSNRSDYNRFLNSLSDVYYQWMLNDIKTTAYRSLTIELIIKYLEKIKCHTSKKSSVKTMTSKSNE